MKAITPAVLDAIFQNFNLRFNDAFKSVSPMWPSVAMECPSETTEEHYGWLGQMPRIREWLGERVYNSLEMIGYVIRNKDYESTITVLRNQILDDKLGIFSPMMSQLGRSAALFPDELVFALLNLGFTTNCFDGQYFFDVDHPVKDANGVVQSVSNVQTGSSARWFLMDTTQVFKPLIWQPRQPFNFVSKTDPNTSDRVFDRKEYAYGVDGRGNAGFGFWQLAFGSQAALTKANFDAARTAMLNLKLDMGRPANIKPNLLVVGPSLEQTARQIIGRELIPDGIGGMMSNEDYKIVDVKFVPWLD